MQRFRKKVRFYFSSLSEKPLFPVNNQQSLHACRYPLASQRIALASGLSDNGGTTDASRLTSPCRCRRPFHDSIQAVLVEYGRLAAVDDAHDTSRAITVGVIDVPHIIILPLFRTSA